MWARKAVFTISTTLFLFITNAVTAAAPSPGPSNDGTAVHITIMAKSANAPIANAYISLVPHDQPLNRPVREVIAPAGVADFKVPPGRYVLRATASGFDPNHGELVVVHEVPTNLVINLQPELFVSGTVTAADGKPVANARVTHVLAVPPPPVRGLSEMAYKAVGARLHTTTDATGAWRLPVSSSKKTLLMVEAPGYAPGWIACDPGGSRSVINVSLQKGGVLRAKLDRDDPAVILFVALVTEGPSVVPRPMQPHVWAREASRSVEWDALPEGEYRIWLRSADPRRFEPPAEIGRATITAGGTAKVALKLPATPPVESSFVRLFIPSTTQVADLRAFGGEKGRIKEVPHSREETVAGEVIYVAGSSTPKGMYLTTKTQLMVASMEPRAASHQASTSFDTIRLQRAEGTLHIIGPKGVPLPKSALETLHDCDRGSVELPVNVPADGKMSIPLAVSCRAVTLQFDSFTPVTIDVSVAEGEKKFLGDHRLLAPSTAEIHVMREPSGTDAAGATVKALVRRGGDVKPIAVAEAKTDDRGRVIMKDVPSGEDVIFEAHDAVTELIGSTTIHVDPAKRVTVDPLDVPEWGTLTVSTELDPELKSEYPSASILGVSITREEAESRDTRTVNYNKDTTEGVFRDLAPGRWDAEVLINIDGTPQMETLDAATLKSGEDKHVSMKVKPLIATGQVFSHGKGTQVSLSIGEPPSPSSGRRRVDTAADGTFKIVLPRPAIYYVEAQKLDIHALATDLGPVMFDGSVIRLEMPDAGLVVHVTRGGQPVDKARVSGVRHADNPDGSGVTEVTADAKTDANGVAKFDQMTGGVWSIQAHASDQGVAEKDVTIGASGLTEMTLDLTDNDVFEGIVLAANGAPAASASVDCDFFTGQTLQSARADTGPAGHFVMHLPKPVPVQLQCGVTTADGAIEAFPVPAVSRDAQFVMPPLGGALTISDWGQKVIPDRFWLIADDGRLFNLSWVARKIGRIGAPLVIGRVPAGHWTLFQIVSTAQLFAVGRGSAQSLTPMIDINMQPGQSRTISVQDVTTVASSR